MCTGNMIENGFNLYFHCIVIVDTLVTYHLHFIHNRDIYTLFTHFLTHPFNLHAVTNWDLSIVIKPPHTHTIAHNYNTQKHEIYKEAITCILSVVNRNKVKSI